MKFIKPVSALLSGIIAVTAAAAVPSNVSEVLFAQVQTANAAKTVDLDYTLKMNVTLTYTFDIGVTEVTSSDTSTCTASVSSDTQVVIKAVKPGYADITVKTPSEYVYVIHITIPGEGVTTAPVTTTSKSASTTKTTSATASSPTTSPQVSTVTTKPVTVTEPVGLMKFSGDGDYFNQAVKQSESFETERQTSSQTEGYDMFGKLDYLTEMTDSTGEIYAALGTKDKAVVIQKSTFHHTIMNNPGYTFASATFGDDDCIYALWGKTLDNSSVDELNVMITKFTKSGQFLKMYTLSSADTESTIPFDAGNGRLAYKNGKLVIMFDTEWKSGHQGAELYRLDTAKGEFDIEDTNVCSHSFGIDLIPTDTGFVSIQKGDCYDRGIVMQELDTSRAGIKQKLAWHISGIYAEPGEHQNATFTHMGGIAYNKSTYAIVGKSERFYTSSNYKNYKTGIYDGFVRIISRTGDNSGIGGTDRIDESTGETADTNVIWLTDSSGDFRTGNIKIAALSGDRYCVLWEVLKNGKFDHVSYEILSSKGEILQPETVVTDARLSSTSVDPIVQDDVIIWAVSEYKNKSVDWYSLDTKSYVLRGDVNSDGTISAADLVKYSRYLLAGDSLTYTQESAADLTSDGRADTFDMVLLRKKVIAGKKQ